MDAVFALNFNSCLEPNKRDNISLMVHISSQEVKIV